MHKVHKYDSLCYSACVRYISVHLNDNAQTPLGRFVVYDIQRTLQQIVTNRTDEAYALVYRSYSIDRRR